MYTITLADGTKLKNLEKNGNNYVSGKAIEDAVFEGNLGTVTITDGTDAVTYTDMALMQNVTYGDGKSYFILREKTQQEKEREALEADITSLQLALAEVYELVLGGA